MRNSKTPKQEFTHPFISLKHIRSAFVHVVETIIKHTFTVPVSDFHVCNLKEFHKLIIYCYKKVSNPNFHERQVMD